MASNLVLHCLPMSHKKDGRLIWVKEEMLFKGILTYKSYYSPLELQFAILIEGVKWNNSMIFFLNLGQWLRRKCCLKDF